MKAIVCIPTFNIGLNAPLVCDAILKQSVKIPLLVIDSSSTDGEIKKLDEIGARIHVISKNAFNHGATRQLALSLSPEAEFIIFMTQDSILESADSIKNILLPFENKSIGAVCGRQIPYPDASPISSHARLFNYKKESSVKSKRDIPILGIKAAFLSNSFAAYRRTALIDVGGFPSDVIFGEDTYVAAKMLQAGWKVFYAAGATCLHSHNYSMMEEFCRYFDLGVFLSREKWFTELLGKPEGEGKKFVFSELNYLVKKHPSLIPSAMVRVALKLFGYKLGRIERHLPAWIRPMLSMNKGYWLKITT